MSSSSPVSRRGFLGGVVAATAAGAAASSFGALNASAAGRARPKRPPRRHDDYGPLQSVRDQTTGLALLALPRGFQYMTYGWTGDPMSDGNPTPSAHDGMAAFRPRNGSRRVHLVRNHEQSDGQPFSADAVYDTAAAGGTSNLVFDLQREQWVESYASLTGTIRNCAGGPTPWGSWLTCEETTQINNPGTADEIRHGYVFDVPADGLSNAVPLPELGRFSHEATCTDPRTGIVYLTEDATPSGFYRFVPYRKGDLDDGTLQMLAIDGVPDVHAAGTGESWSTHWVTILHPDPGAGEQSTVQQGVAQGGTSISRGEGAWFGNDKAYFISTDGGPAGQGQVFEYDPRAERLSVLFASPNAETLNNPDNVCVSPRGGLVLCEDGSNNEFLHGLTPDGAVFPFAQNLVDLTGGTAGKNVAPENYMGSEWAGATFEPQDGDWLFANIQTPGITFAITGPWRRGAL